MNRTDAVHSDDVLPLYTRDDVPAASNEYNTPPGTFPFARGPYPGMYRTRPWTMRQYAGFATAQQTNERFHYLLKRGQTGLSVAFDLPTQLGLDSDDPRALGEVGRTGVAIDSIDDMRILFAGIPLAEVSTSMTINAPSALLLLMYDIVSEEQGAPARSIRGTIQNDILKEYVARGNYIFPPQQSLRLTTDIFSWCAEHAPNFNTISISGYHIREAGSTAAQELGITFAHAIAYVDAAVAAGLDLTDICARLSFFFNSHNDVFVEVAKFRAARVVWATLLHDRYNVSDDRLCRLRFHAQTGGSTLTAQQPHNNIVRVALQAFAAAGGGAQSIHTNGFDEALALPTEESAQIALRTQQILQEESGICRTADPFAGSYYIESLTSGLIDGAREIIAKVDELGGAVLALEAGYFHEEIESSAFEWQQQVERGDRVIVGANKYREQGDAQLDIPQLSVDPAIEIGQRESLAARKQVRDAQQVAGLLAEVRTAAGGTDNLLPIFRRALVAGCTVGEMCGTLRDVWGEYR